MYIGLHVKCPLFVLDFNESLTPILLTWKIGCAPNNASRWQMGFNQAFKGLKVNVCMVGQAKAFGYILISVVQIT